jgi:hypothetical protein
MVATIYSKILYSIDISGKDCRAENPYPWNVSTKQEKTTSSEF